MTVSERTPAAPTPPTSAEAGLVATGVHRRFGSVHALRGLSMTAAYGEVTGLVGPNGAGKTTLLLILATLLTPDAGEVRVGGHNPTTDTDAVRAVMGWVPDAFGVYDNLTALEYLEFAGVAHRLSRNAAAQRARELLAVARLEEFAVAPVHVLSRGQKQRLGLVRALVHRPRVLLLDEPAAGLDPHSRVHLRSLLRELAKNGAAVLVSSHILSDLEELADRIVIVDQGSTVGENRIDDLVPVMAARAWRLRALDTAALTAALDRLGHAYEAAPNGGVDVQLGTDADAAALISALVKKRVQLVMCAPAAGNLEAAYLQLTHDERT
ncbi:MAG: ABC transporter ATP-binding protein [Actinomycetes bacterium]